VTIAVVDRAGRPLGIFERSQPLKQRDIAVGVARSAAFFSNDRAPLSSRTVRFISGIHFPPGIPNTPNAALYGIENTNRGCDLHVTFLPGKALPPARSVLPGLGGRCDPFDRRGCGSGPITGKFADPSAARGVELADAESGDFAPALVHPGGVPIYRGARLLGALGITRPGVRGDPQGAGAAVEGAAIETVLAAGLSPLPDVGLPARDVVVFIDGIRLPFVENLAPPPGFGPGDPHIGSVVLGPKAGGCVAHGYLVGPHAGSELSAAEVDRLVQQARGVAQRTRAFIRLPPGRRTRMAISVADTDGTVLALFRMQDATVFSVDVAVAKARNVVYFSDPAAGGAGDLDPSVPAGTAITNRTISFGAQPFYPPGIDRDPGPFFDLFTHDVRTPCSQGRQPSHADQNGVVFFPGSMPLFRAGRLVGGFGISGDGVEQDDYVSFFGAEGFRPPEAIWADRVLLRGVRLPFIKFPRNPEQ